ncbi:MAG: sigma-70 family RNA polymerase sigma factor [Armatimonadetes bacterium]|nr:sigma-70 family RNA polymerase sigma factor [Armatimonadota bacterium]
MSPIEKETDRELVQRIRRGEIEAFDVLHRRYYARIYRLTYLKTNHAEDAKDIASETFCRAFQNLDQYEFRRSESIYPWLHRIALNLVIDWGRAKPPAGMVSLDSETAEGTRLFWEQLADTGPGPQEIVEKKEVQELVRCAIAGLPPDQHDAVMHRFIGGLSVRETAEALNRTEGAVKSLIHRAMISLRKDILKRVQEAEKLNAYRQGKTGYDTGDNSLEIHRRTR